MMLLSDIDIKREMEHGELRIDGMSNDAIQPASVDLQLDNHFRVFNYSKYTCIDPGEEQENLTTRGETTPHGMYILPPGMFMLSSTKETITLGSSLAGRLEGKSSLGRLGLVVHSTAGFIDPGFSGQLTLELSNVSGLPILLYAGMKICQLCFFRLSTPVETPYGSDSLRSKYQGQVGPTPSESWRNFYTDSSGIVLPL